MSAAAHGQAMAAAVRAHCPDLIPEIRDLHREGLIDGWRNITAILPEGPPRPLNAINAAVWLENSKPMHRGEK